MVLVEQIASFASQNLWLFFFACMLCTAFIGDVTLIVFVSLAMALNIHLGIIFVAAYIGTLIGDAVWFKIGLMVEKNLDKRKKLKKEYRKIANLIDKVFKKRLFLALGVAKVLAGTRVIMTFYFAREKTGFWKFFKYNLGATLFWVLAIGSIGVAVGYGLTYIADIFHDFQWIVLILMIIMLIIYYIQNRVSKWISKEY